MPRSGGLATRTEPLKILVNRGRRRGLLLSKWLTEVPGDAWRSRHVSLPPPYRRIYFFHVRKTAGTSLYKAFLALSGEDPGAIEARFAAPTYTARSGEHVYIRTELRLVVRHTPYLFGYSHAPSWRVSTPPHTFTVTMLRDPVERVLSLYRYLADESSDASEPTPAPAIERGWAADGLGPFLERVPERTLMHQLWMFSERFDPEEAAARIRACTLYFFTESYDLGLSALAQRLALPLQRRADRVSVPQPSPSDADLEHLRTLMAPERRLIELLRADPGPGLVGPVPQPA